MLLFICLYQGFHINYELLAADLLYQKISAANLLFLRRLSLSKYLITDVSETELLPKLSACDIYDRIEKLLKLLRMFS